MSLKDQASVIFGQLQKAFKRLELDLDYTYDVQIGKIKSFQDSLSLIAELEQLVMNDEQPSEEEESDDSFVDKDHSILMNQLKDNIELVNGYKQQIQEIRRQNLLINKLAKDDYEKENYEVSRKKQRNYEKVKEIQSKIKQRQEYLHTVNNKMKGRDRKDHHILGKIEKLDSEIEQITYQIRDLID
ncbi:hypothetical protein pb186bvf_004648 [Paramecium bursaria]